MDEQNRTYVPTFLSLGLEMYVVKEINKHHNDTLLIHRCLHTTNFNTPERKAFGVLKRSEFENKLP